MNASENTHPSKQTVRIAILVSGGGRSLQNILDLITNGRLTGCNVCLVIASNKSAAALQRAAVSDVPTRVVRLRDYEGSDEFSEGVSKVLDAFEVDLVVMAGWMHFYRIPTRYDGKVINIHPSLIPAFCGKGYYGHRVHQAVVCSLFFSLFELCLKRFVVLTRGFIFIYCPIAG